MLHSQLHNYVTMNITFFFIDSYAPAEHLYVSAGAKAEASPAGFLAFWGCCDKWRVHML